MLLTCLLIAFTVDDVYKSRVDAAVVLQNHPRIMENCVEQFEGTEGAPIDGFQVQKVLIFTTSGLLTPRVQNGGASLLDPDDHSHFCSFKQMSKYVDITNYADTLTMKEKLHNKKTKQAFKNVEPLPKVKDCGRHSLSSFGVLQLINLGNYLFQSYFGKLQSLDSMFPSHKFANTFGDQTLFQSLSALLYGLLNEKQFVYTHVDKLSSDFSTASQFKEQQQSLHYFVEQSFTKENHFFKDSKVFAFNRRYATGLLSGADVSSKDIISYLSNCLCSESQNHDKSFGISYDDVSHIFNVSDSYNNYLTTSSLFWSYSVSRTASLWTLVKNWLSPLHTPYRQEMGNSNSNDDLKLITVDDLFMFSLLRTLNVTVSRHIAPASRLIVESFVLQDSVSDSADRTVGQLREDHGMNMKQVRIDQHTKSLPKNIVQNQFAVLSHDNSPERKAFNGSLKAKNLSLEKVGKGDSSLLSHNRNGTMKLHSEDQKSHHSKLSQKHTFQTYIRLLYNGHVITSVIPACNSDEAVTLGLCPFEVFEYFLTSIQSVATLSK